MLTTYKDHYRPPAVLTVIPTTSHGTLRREGILPKASRNTKVDTIFKSSIHKKLPHVDCFSFTYEAPALLPDKPLQINDFLLNKAIPKKIRNIAKLRSKQIGHLKMKGYSEGSGTLVSSSLFITAGHCFLEFDGWYAGGKLCTYSLAPDPINDSNRDIGPLKSKDILKKEEEKHESQIKRGNLFKKGKIKNQPFKQKISVQFDYLDETSSVIEIESELICAEMDGLIDYALIRLNQPVTDRNFAPISLKYSDNLIMIHHPKGDSQQVSIGNKILSHHLDYEFGAFIHSDRGSSGAGLFNNRGGLFAIHVERMFRREDYKGLNEYKVTSGNHAFEQNFDPYGVASKEYQTGNTLIKEILERNNYSANCFKDSLIRDGVMADGIPIGNYYPNLSGLSQTDIRQRVITPQRVGSLIQVEASQKVKDLEQKRSQPVCLNTTPLSLSSKETAIPRAIFDQCLASLIDERKL
jgi:hypothetical protein